MHLHTYQSCADVEGDCALPAADVWQQLLCTFRIIVASVFSEFFTTIFTAIITRVIWSIVITAVINGRRNIVCRTVGCVQGLPAWILESEYSVT
jgi:hypothetical protein